MTTKAKRILYSVFLVAAFGVNALGAVHEKFAEGYEFLPTSSVDRNEKVSPPMSLYKDGQIVFFLQDSAYIAKAGSNLDLTGVRPFPELNGLGIEGTFAYDPKGDVIYFTKTDVKTGMSDLYEVRGANGTYSQPKMLDIEGMQNIRKPIRGSSAVYASWTYRYKKTAGFYNPTLSKNGDRIYFSADFTGKGSGGRDLWYIDKNKNRNVTAGWRMPVSASDSLTPINTTSREDYPYVSGDSVLYFASDREGQGGLDIYFSRRSTRTEVTRDTSGNILKTEKLEVWDTPKKLDPDFNSSGNDYNLLYTQKAIFFVSTREGTDNIYRAALYTAETEDELSPDFTIDEPKGFHWVLFFFDFNQATMKPEYEAQLNELISAMKEFPGAKFEISGHTDSRGSDEYNMKLSQRRADYIRDMLIKRGLPANKLISVGRGWHEPVIPNAQKEEEHEQNRRAEIMILED